MSSLGFGGFLYISVAISTRLVVSRGLFAERLQEIIESHQWPSVGDLCGEQVGIDQEKAAQASGLKFSEVEQ